MRLREYIKKWENNNKIAIDAKEDRITYDQLFRKIQIYMQFLNEKCKYNDRPIGIACGNSVNYLCALLAIRYMGWTSILLGNDMKDMEYDYHIKNAGIRYIIGEEKALKNIGVVSLEAFLNEKDFFITQLDTEKTLNIEEGDFFIQITSGTNGAAKAVIRTENAVLSEIFETIKYIDMSSEDNVLTLPMMYHSYGLIGGALAPLIVGATLYIRKRYSPIDMYYDLISEPITILFAVPFMYRQLIHILKHRQQLTMIKQTVHEQTVLRYCFAAGTILPQEVQDEFYELFKIPICIDYGSTENGVICLNLDPINHRGSVGKIIPNSELMILNEYDQPVISGTIGEIVIKSPNRAKCYAYPKELNNMVFKNGLYYTGDYAVLDEEGYVHLKGKKGMIINVAGKKIDPIEIEEVIKSIDGIQACVVIGVKNEATGQELKAYIVTTPGNVKEETIIKYCHKKLSAYKVPKKFEFINRIPKNPNGKVLRKELLRIEGEEV